MKKLCEAGGEGRELVQRAVDWMFPMGVEWFGMPDDRKRHNAQLDFKLKGMTNDQLRATWLKAVVPLCESLGLDVPAHSDPETGEVELEYALPCEWDADERRWLFDTTITWEQVFDRWRARGPMNEEFVTSIRKSRAQTEKLLAA
jgi:ring-1,2-phenylacetyl-CoA epoxidase subunit PaaA